MPERSLSRDWRDRDHTKRGTPGWQEQEALLPELQPGGRQQRGSGSGRGASRKGDSVGDLLLVSGKTTEKLSHSVKREWLEAAEQQAEAVGLLPALCVGFDARGRQPRLDYVALERGTVARLIRLAAAVRDGDFELAQRESEMLWPRTGLCDRVPPR